MVSARSGRISSETQILSDEFGFAFFNFAIGCGGTQSLTAVANRPGEVAGRSKFNTGCLPAQKTGAVPDRYSAQVGGRGEGI